MREKKTHLYFDSEERKLLLHSLVELKNQLIQQGRYTDPVDELIFKVVNAPVKRMKIEYADHVGIVEKCENGVVYTVEGNSGDACRQNSYPVGYYEILGYGCPSY